MLAVILFVAAAVEGPVDCQKLWNDYVEYKKRCSRDLRDIEYPSPVVPPPMTDSACLSCDDLSNQINKHCGGMSGNVKPCHECRQGGGGYIGDEECKGHEIVDCIVDGKGLIERYTECTNRCPPGFGTPVRIKCIEACHDSVLRECYKNPDRPVKSK